jgi:DNA polymerase-3 subunit epsilon
MQSEEREVRRNEDTDVVDHVGARSKILAPRVSEIEVEVHEALVARLGEKAVWAKYR